MTRYVAGLYTSGCKKFDVLIKKNKPGHWLHDKINLIGGHIEAGDKNENEAMAREFYEETGEVTNPHAWRKSIVLTGPGWVVYFFYMQGPSFTPYSSEEGEVHWHFELGSEAVPNLHWIIPLLKDENVLFPLHIMQGK